MDQFDALFVKLASLEEAQDKIKKLLLEKTIALLEDPSLYNDRYVLWENTTSEIDQTVMAFSPVKNVSMMSYFRLYQLSLKLKMFVDISCRDRELGACKFGDNACDIGAYRCEVSQYQNVKAILDDAMEVQEHLEKVRLVSREKAVIALAKALPFPREVLFVLLDKMVEVQDENPDENDVWRIEKVTESEKLEGHGLDGQNFLDIYNAMIEIYKGLKRFRRFWKNAMQKVCGSIEADVKSRREIRRMINDLKREFGSDYYKLFEEINF